ncbi:MAG: hypothetical protein JKY54_02810 [Flavobacteriales bacterium]|nr:hypothetical protein [Flavobacteriales bacterium]
MNIKRLFVKTLIAVTLTSSVMSCGKGDDDDKPVLTLKEATSRLAGKESKIWKVDLREISAKTNLNINGYKLTNLQFYFLPDVKLEFLNDYNSDGHILRQEIAKLQNPWMPYEEGFNEFVYETIESRWYWTDKKHGELIVNYIGDKNEVHPVMMTVKRLKKKSCVLYYTIENIFVIQDLTFED